MIIVTDIVQGSPEWFSAKIGKLSASNASKIITTDGKPSKQREGYLYELAAEIITGKSENGYTNGAMANGIERESESRDYYSFVHGVEVQQVGLIYKDEGKRLLCSPDGIVNNEYGVELKNPLGKTQVKYLLDGDVPTEYFAQIQFSLFVTGFKFWDFCSYVPNMDALILRVEPDKTFQTALKGEVERFINDLDTVVKKLKKG